MLTALSDKTYRVATQILFSLLAIIVLLTYRHYGITWDEELQSDYGIAVLKYYMSGFHDHSYKEIFNLYLYGGMFDGLAAILDLFTPHTIYETRHLLNAVLGMLGLWGTWKLGRLMGGGFVGLAAFLLLLFTPMYYGHMYNNPKDIPFAAGVIWTLYYMSKTLFAFPHVKTSLMIKLGIVYGLTLGVRVNGVMLFAHWGAMLSILALVSMHKWHLPHIGRAIFKVAKVVLPTFIITYLVMLFCWPWAQEAPIMNPLRAIMEFSNFPQDVEVLLNGVIFKSTELPWYYVPLYFLVQLPLLHLIIMCFGLFFIIDIFMKINMRGRRAAIGLLVLSISFPIVYAMFGKPALYDAVRHFIFVVPPLCIMCAIVLKKIIRSVVEDDESGTSPSIKWIVASVVTVLFFAPAYGMGRLHPYEYIYTNEAFGGVEGSFGGFEMDYWGSSFREAANELDAYVSSRDPEYKSKKYKVAICGPWSAATLYMPSNFEAVDADLKADFFLSTTRWMCQDMRQGHEIIRVSRMSVPLSIIKDVRGFPLP